MDFWVASDQARALSSGEEELYGNVDGPARSRRTLRSRSGFAPERASERRGTSRSVAVWVQDATRDKVVRLEGIENEADMGTKDVDRPTHLRALFAEFAA